MDAAVDIGGVQELTKVTLSRCGVLKTIHATPDHVWLLSPLQRSFSKRKITCDLRAGDRLATVYPQRPCVLVPDPVGVARGFVFGDGSVSSRNRARANFCGEKDRHLLPAFAATGFGLAPRVYAKGLTVINGLPIHWKTQMPSLDDDPSMTYGWLSGYFAADGDVDRTGRPTLTSAKQDNLEFVRALCTRLGIGTFGVRTTMRRGYGAAATRLYLLGMMRKDLDAAFFRIPMHRRRFLDSIDGVAERRAWTVVSVHETARVEQVFRAGVAFALEDNILVHSTREDRASS